MPESEVRRICAVEPSEDRTLHRDRHLGLGVVGEVDRVDCADRLAADEHLVARHELTARLEHELVLAPTVVAEEHDDDQRDRSDQRAHRKDAAQSVYGAEARRRSALRGSPSCAHFTPPFKPSRPVRMSPSWSLDVQTKLLCVIVSLLWRQPSVFSTD